MSGTETSGARVNASFTLLGKVYETKWNRAVLFLLCCQPRLELTKTVSEHMGLI